MLVFIWLCSSDGTSAICFPVFDWGQVVFNRPLYILRFFLGCGLQSAYLFGKMQVWVPLLEAILPRTPKDWFRQFTKPCFVGLSQKCTESLTSNLISYPGFQSGGHISQVLMMQKTRVKQAKISPSQLCYKLRKRKKCVGLAFLWFMLQIQETMVSQIIWARMTN